MLEKRLTALKMPFGTVVLVLKMTILIVIVPTTLSSEPLQFENKIHSYSRQETDVCKKDENVYIDCTQNTPFSPMDILKMENVDSKEQITQTIQTCVNTGVQAVKPDITIEDIQNNNEQILFYTGLPDFDTFNALFESLKKIGAVA